MGVIFECPQCNGQMEAEQGGLKGRLVSCPHCGAQVKVPEADQAPLGETPVEQAPAEEASAEAGGSKLSAGTIVRGIYKIDRLLGESSLGEMYVASVVTDNRQVQLEIIDGSDQETIDRLSREIELLAAMEHPNIVRAFDAGQDNDNGVFFLASDYEDGQTLQELIKAGPLDEKEALGHARGICEALDYAWDKRKILHRDVKPANIFITQDGRAKLMGFGIAKSSEGQSMGLTGVGFTVGTPEYMSPEQIKADENLDYRSDMYALGCVLYEMVTGRLPFQEDAPILLMQKHMDEDPEAAHLVNPSVSESTSDVIGAMMEKDREDRPADWSELCGFIDNAVAAAGTAPAAAPQQPASSSGGETPASKGKFGCGGMLAMVATLVIGIGVAIVKLI